GNLALRVSLGYRDAMTVKAIGLDVRGADVWLRSPHMAVWAGIMSHMAVKTHLVGVLAAAFGTGARIDYLMALFVVLLLQEIEGGNINAIVDYPACEAISQ